LGNGWPVVLRCFRCFSSKNTAAELSFAAEILGFRRSGMWENSKTVRCSLLLSAVLVDGCNKLKYRFPQDGSYLDEKFL
jgi:hypothetical protein